MKKKWWNESNAVRNSTKGKPSLQSKVRAGKARPSAFPASTQTKRPQLFNNVNKDEEPKTSSKIQGRVNHFLSTFTPADWTE